MTLLLCVRILLFFFKQKTAYEVRMSDWSSDVCSSDLASTLGGVSPPHLRRRRETMPRPIRKPFAGLAQPLLGVDHVARREPILAAPVLPQRHQPGRGPDRKSVQ